MPRTGPRRFLALLGAASTLTAVASCRGASEASADTWRLTPTDTAIPTDDNFLPLNPRWEWQTVDGTQPHFNFNKLPDGWTRDQPASRNWLKRHLLCAGGQGHANGGEATMTTRAYWDQHGFDDDYNIRFVSTPLSDTNLQYRALTVGHPAATDIVPTIEGEFNATETVRLNVFDHSKWWTNLRRRVDEVWQGAASPADIIDGHDAVVTGLVGLDTVHGGGVAEIHPIHALAIRTGPASTRGDEDVWAVFVRNYGDEGYCSSQDHGLSMNHFALRLPIWSDSRLVADRVSVEMSAAGWAGPLIDIYAGDANSVVLSFNFDTNGQPAPALYAGDVRITWKSAIGTSARSHALPTQTGALDADQIADEYGKPSLENQLTGAITRTAVQTRVDLLDNILKLRPRIQPVSEVTVRFHDESMPAASEQPRLNSDRQRTVAETAYDDRVALICEHLPGKLRRTHLCTLGP